MKTIKILTLIAAVLMFSCQVSYDPVLKAHLEKVAAYAPLELSLGFAGGIINDNSVYFNDVMVGNDEVRAFYIKNNGYKEVNISVSTSNNVDFFQNLGPVNIQPDGIVPFNVVFNPASAGQKYMELTITETSTQESVIFYFHGNGYI